MQSSFTQIEGLSPNPQVPQVWLAPTLREAAVAFGAGSHPYLKVWRLENSLNGKWDADVDAMSVRKLINASCGRLTRGEMKDVSTDLVTRCIRGT